MKTWKARLLGVLVCLLSAVVPDASAEAAPDLILHNGRVFVAPGRFAEAVAVSGNRIVDVGTSAALLARKGLNTRLLDLRGRAVTPGFHDAHLDFMRGALALGRADLSGLRGVAAVQVKLNDFAKSGSESWILGRGWDEAAFPGGLMPTREDLDAVLSMQPVALTHADGEVLWANSLALKEADITTQTPEPAGGRILRDPNGEPSGILTGTAAALLEAAMPAPDRGLKKAALMRALELARSQGVTAIQGPLGAAAEEQLQLWKQLDKEDKVQLRYFAWGDLEDPEEAARLQQASATLPPEKFRLGGLYGVVDGALSGRTAALFSPYADDPATTGEPRFSQEKLSGLVSIGRQQGFQVVLHAVGDRAVHLGLEACRGQNLDSAAPPCKLERVGLVTPEDLAAFRAENVAASLQPGRQARVPEAQDLERRRLGPSRVKRAFAYLSLQEAGALTAFGSGWPAAPLHPRVALFAATTRPGEGISLEEAVSAYTLGSARAIGRDRELGSIEKGKLADLAVFDQDIFALRGALILNIEIDVTIFDGRLVFERGGASAKNP